MGLFDVHAHLTDRRLAPQADEVWPVQAAGVTTIISNGLNPDDNEATLRLAERYDIVQPALGLYPVDAVLPEMLAAGIGIRETEAAPPAAERRLRGWKRTLTRPLPSEKSGWITTGCPSPLGRQETVSATGAAGD